MRTRSLLALLAAVLLAAFVVLNWPAFIAPTALAIGPLHFEAPLGLLMLGLLLLVTVALLVQMAFWQGAMLLETRRQARELQAQRQLAEEAEASRFTALRTEIRDSANSLAAMLAELDDRWQRQGGRDKL
jgi:uncharacterized integral membrane protein